ncbi:putative phage tail protein [Anaerosalibacter sp. Marseille-P3206]|uniref:putative phage tail protein n=1 Tax=Anaerosalibacter sp. Marseille-P3206 TaxID=1871005 RepID=UPI0013564C07|nr:putative phage tail protein [Anaerosalibacter sp. Marseille-P3206]
MEAETEQEVQGVVLEYSKAFNEVITELKGQGVRVEFSPTIVSTTTEMIVNIVVSKRDYKSAMLEYLPWYERKSIIFDSILNAYDKEFRQLEQGLDIVDRNMLLDTAIEKLNIYERDLGIKAIQNLKYDQRREQISSRYIASFDQTTEETIKSVAQAYSNGEVEVNPTDTDGLYEIKFIGSRGVPNNLEGLKQALDIVIPAHLGLTYKYTFTPWEDLKLRTWGDCLPKTWNELRVWEGVI